jgi:hypothetical protein
MLPLSLVFFLVFIFFKKKTSNFAKMAADFCDFMDIDDEYILQDITSQIVEFRKDTVLETHYESSLTVCASRLLFNAFL